MALLRHQKFIETYERKIKKIREDYYRKQALNNKETISVDLTLVQTILTLVTFLVIGPNLKGFITVFIVSIILSIIFKYISSILGVKELTDYLRETKRLGYISINAYEKALKKYITGEKGYYQQKLEELKKEYHLTDQIRKIYGIHGEEYYIWVNSDQDSINLLNTNPNIKPEIIQIRMNNIRYYRIDSIQKYILLKTDIEYYYFTMQALEIFNEIMLSKRFDNQKTFNPEEYISDFEIYIHHFLENLNKQNPNNINDFDIEINKFIINTILYIILCGLTFVLNFNLLYILIIISIISLNYTFSSLLSTKKEKANNEIDAIKILNSNESCLERFDELKTALNISENYDRIYSKDNATYLTWVANGYFHIFLNVVYTNVIYMAVKVSDVNYYRKTHNECILKMKEKTLEFRKDAKNVFDKILPNKDYNWLKGYQHK